MSKLRLLSSLMMLLLASIVLVSCNNDDDDMPPPPPDEPNVMEYLRDQAEYSSLVAALEEAGLDDDLEGLTTLTLFAPDNDAFADFLSNNGWAGVGDIPDDALVQVLLYHVLGDEVLSSGIIPGYATTLSPSTPDASENLVLYIDTDGGVTVNGISVTDADQEVSNGVIHGVEDVIGLPDVTTFVVNDPFFSSLEAALGAASVDFVSVLQGDGPFTVLAPDNNAFQALLDGNPDWSGLEDVPAEVLDDVLAYHVIEANALSGSLSDGDEITTFAGGMLTVSIDGSDVSFIDEDGNSAMVNLADLQSNNGVVHGIDAVLIPEAYATTNMMEWLRANEDYSTLVAALETAGLDGVLAGSDPYALFAPDNDAFQALLDSNDEWNGLDDIPSDVLTSVLLNHVLPGDMFDSGNLETGYYSTASPSPAQEEGDDDSSISMYINTEDGVVINGGPSVVAADNMVSNGVIHEVDAVIGLPTVVTFATADPTFTNLVAALTAYDDFEFVELLSGEGPFTVFAPDNDAFQALLDSEEDWDSPSDIDETVLATVLSYHVANGNVTSSELTDGQTIPTLADDLILTIGLDPVTVTDLNANTYDVIAADVQAVNGVIHVVNGVLLPAP